MFLDAARHPTTLTEGGKPVFWNVTGAISARDGQAEAKHANDIKQARDLSIKEAETVLTDHVIGKTFPAAGTQAQAEQKVLDKITSKLTHTGLGNDQTKWAAIYETLYRKTLTRDNNAWHTFALGGRVQNPAGEVDYTLNNGSTSINTTTSAALRLLSRSWHPSLPSRPSRTIPSPGSTTSRAPPDGPSVLGAPPRSSSLSASSTARTTR